MLEMLLCQVQATYPGDTLNGSLNKWSHHERRNKILHTFETTAKADIPLKIPNQIPEKENRK